MRGKGFSGIHGVRLERRLGRRGLADLAHWRSAWRSPGRWGLDFMYILVVIHPVGCVVAVPLIVLKMARALHRPVRAIPIKSSAIATIVSAVLVSG